MRERLELDRFAVLDFLPNLLLKLTSPSFRNPRTQESIKEITKKQNRRHPFVIQDGEEKDQADDKKTRQGSRRPPGDCFETWIAQSRKHHDGKKKQEWWEYPFPSANLVFLFAKPPKHKERDGCDQSR